MSKQLARVGICCFSLFFFALCLMPQASGQEEKNRVSVDISGGAVKVPGWIFSQDKDIVQHPDFLFGTSKDLRVDYKVNHKLSVGIHLFRMDANGYGPWERHDSKNSSAEENMVVGVATGKTDWHLTGFAGEVEWRPIGDKHRLYPYIRGGGGIGFLNVGFNGSFSGMDEEGDMFTVKASDSFKRKIPIITAEGGLRLKFGRHIEWSLPSLSWNTGYILKTGIRLNF